jgi:phospholipase/carboxylesterase
MPNLSRRTAIKLASALAGGAVVSACKLTTETPTYIFPDGRIEARPGTAVSGTAAAGTFDLPETTALSHGLYFVPASYTPAVPIPLIVIFHGAGQQASSLLTPMSAIAEELGVVVMAIKSREATWDVIINGVYGIDVNFLNRSLTGLFSRIRIDSTRIGVAGFSDGATYALSLGRVNGDLFSRIVAFSPGGIAAGGTPVGKPSVFITHGTNDAVLPISITKTTIMPRLEAEGYPVQLHEFDGAHSIPASLLRQGMEFLHTR